MALPAGFDHALCVHLNLPFLLFPYNPIRRILSSHPSNHRDNACRDLFRRLRPLDVSVDLDRLCRMAPDMEDELRDRVDKPLTSAKCSRSGREFLCCDYNRDGDFWRSPWSNELEPSSSSSSAAASGGGGTAGGNDSGRNTSSGSGDAADGAGVRDEDKSAGAALRPSDRVRKIEVLANEAFSVYRDQ